MAPITQITKDDILDRWFRGAKSPEICSALHIHSNVVQDVVCRARTRGDYRAVRRIRNRRQGSPLSLPIPAEVVLLHPRMEGVPLLCGELGIERTERRVADRSAHNSINTDTIAVSVPRLRCLEEAA